MGKWDFLKPCDTQVHKALAAGDVKEAFEILLQGYEKPVRQYCTALLGNQADGEDVAQEVFLAIWQALPKYEQNALLRTWIFAIVRYRCSTYRRNLWNKAKVLVINYQSIIMTAVSDPPPSPDNEHMANIEIMHLQDQLRHLERCLRRLPKGDRALIMMHYYEELSYREMARLLRQPEATIRRTVHAIIEKHLGPCMAQGEAV